jgi:hypothetical protein
VDAIWKGCQKCPKGEGSISLLQITGRDSWKARLLAPISWHSRVPFVLVIKMFIIIPFLVELSSLQSHEKHPKD